MTDRLVDISEGPARLSVSLDRLVVKREGAEEVFIPLADIAALCVSHPNVVYTHAVLAGLARAGAALVVCNDRRLPAGLMLPLEGNTTQAERFIKQAEASQPLRKRLWSQLVQAKVRAQGRLLEQLHGHDFGLKALAGQVRSGDPDNIEAQASRRYWPVIFGDGGFRRDFEAEDQNRYLNYGYAILRALTGRAICSAGLHPSLGLHHHNRYNPYCLADDLMEPFRPLVDKAVAALCEARGPDAPLDAATKSALIGPMTGRLTIKGESRTMFDVLARLAASLAACFLGQRNKLNLPEC